MHSIGSFSTFIKEKQNEARTVQNVEQLAMGWETEVQLVAENFSLHPTAWPSSGDHGTSQLRLFSTEKCPQHKADHLPPSNAQIKIHSLVTLLLHNTGLFINKMNFEQATRFDLCDHQNIKKSMELYPHSLYIFKMQCLGTGTALFTFTI
jgi:hypothetical protein